MQEAARDRCKAIISATSDTLTWDIDGRFGCVVAAFDVEDASAIRGVLGLLEFEWEPETVAGAPARVETVATGLGLRAGQMLYTSDPDDPVMLWAAWWPWGSGKRVSVRIGADGVPVNEVLRWFGLA